ncbi:MAG TPA: RHS repeat-associated core domain-containing protein [Candidatus Angelobacter sp.]|nr:RHS repeat-associated core domain-containing protein [Candidatus Angelobacter sp.]
METSSFITHARGTGSSQIAAQSVGKSTAIEGSQSYTYAVNLFSLPGRNGLDLNLTLFYNSLLWEFNSDNNTMVYGGFDNPAPGFRLDYGLLEFATDLSLGLLTEANGGKHLFVPTAVANQFSTVDSSYILVQYPATAGSPVIVTYKNGLRIYYQLFDTTYQYQYRPYQIEDTNGNIISISYLNNNALSINTITDTVGRVISFKYDSTGTMLQSVAQLSSNGQNFRQYSFNWVNKPINFNFTLQATAGLGIPPGFLTSGQSTENLLAGVTRPDGTSVVFDYVKDLSGVNPDNPDWGIVKSIQEKSSNGTPRYTTSYLLPAASAGSLTSNPTYTQQIVNDGVNTGTWTFQATKNANGLVTCFASEDPLGKVQTTVFSSNGDALDGLPSQQIVSSVAPGTALSGCPTSPAQTWRTDNLSWITDTGGSNARRASVTTILEDGSTQSQVKFNTYDSFGQVTDLLQYDFGANQPGPLVREVVTSYASLGNNIVNRPSDIQVKDGSGTLQSHQLFTYDATGSVTDVASNPTGHDSAFSASYSGSRGNLTSVVEYADAVHSAGGVTTVLTYDSTGNILSSQRGVAGPKTQESFSSVTQFAYPDSISVGPASGQLTTSLVYDLDRGLASTVTDPNGQKTTYGHDADNRLTSTQTPDAEVISSSYDDAAGSPSVTTSSTANSMIAKVILDGRGRTVSTRVLNGTSGVSTAAVSYNILGQLLQTSNPYAPADAVVNTIYAYDGLGRTISVTPPAVGTSTQNAYQTQYAAGTFNDFSANTRSGQIITTTDPAGKQRKQYTDVLGRLVRVDEPGQSGGAAGTGSISISGTEQSASVPNGGGATAATGSVTIGGTERSTVVQTHAATSASVTVTIGGSDGTDTQTSTACTGGPPSRFPLTCRTTTANFADSGSIGFTVNSGGVTVGPVSVTYGGSSTPASLAAALVSAFPANAVVNIGYVSGSPSFTLTTKATSSAANSSTLATSLASGCVPSSSDTSSTLCSQGWTITNGQNFTGGTDSVNTTFYDTGTVAVNVTIGGTVYSKSCSYSQSSTAAGIAGNLASQINSDTTLNQLLVAGASSNVLNLTTTATGVNTADPLSASAATTSQYFTSGSSSFSATPSGPTLTPGQNGTVFDAGTVTVGITGFTAKPKSYTASYSQGSTANSVASAISGAINADSTAPVTASVASGSNVITLTAKTPGSDTNYGVTASAATSQSANFSQPSFNGSGTTLSGGTDPTASLSTPLSTFYTYSANGNLLQVNQGQQVRTYTYDSLGRTTSSCVPETKNLCTTYTYKDYGPVATKTDPRSIVTTYAYDDNFGRLLSVSYSDGTPTVAYAYGVAGASGFAAGRLTSVTSSSAADAYTYDNMGHIIQVVKTIGGQNYTISYHYTNGQLDSTTYPSGRIVYQDHDSIGRLSQIRTGGSTIFSIGSYNAAGEILTTTYGNGMTGAYTYNNQLQLGAISASNAGTPVLNLTYNYAGVSDNGQISGITDGVTPANSTSYVYDELGRLKIAQTTDLTSANTWKLKFSYDRYGNRVSEIPVAGTANMPTSQVPIDPVTNRITSLVYDADGNVVNDNLHSYVYNGAGQVTSVDGSNNSYTYDAAGLRVNRNGTIYIYSAGIPIAEYPNGAAASSPGVEYLYAAGTRVASVASGAFTYLYGDHLSTRVQASGTGAVTRTFGHFPFGESWYETGTADKWKFTTYERDSESGLDYAQARFNSPALGRFISLDPVSGSIGDPQSLNRYAYAHNDPVNLTDPSGAAPGDPSLLCLAGDGLAGSGNASGCAGGGGGFVDGQWISFGVNSLIQAGFAGFCSSCGLAYVPGLGFFTELNGQTDPQNASISGFGYSAVSHSQTVDGGPWDGSTVPGSVGGQVDLGGTMTLQEASDWLANNTADFLDAEAKWDNDHPWTTVWTNTPRINIFNCPDSSGNDQCANIWQTSSAVISNPCTYAAFYGSSALVANTASAYVTIEGTAILPELEAINKTRLVTNALAVVGAAEVSPFRQEFNNAVKDAKNLVSTGCGQLSQ